MRTLGILAFVPSLLLAQTVAQPAAQAPRNAPILRGVLLECDQRAFGELAIRAADNEVLRYQFDPKTYVERDDHLIEPSRLVPGEKVEIVSDRAPGFILRYARTIHVLQ